MESQPYEQISAGTCGVAYEQAGSTYCAKREKSHSYGERNSKNDFRMHRKIHKTLKKYTVDLHVPCPSYLVEVDNEDFWEANQSLFPKEDQARSRLLYTERIPSLSKSIRDALVEEYCPGTKENKEKAHSLHANRNCLIRPYLGRKKLPSNSVLKAFNLANFTLYANQCETVGLEVSPLITAMAQTLAIMHFDAKVDARDVEFVLGGAPTCDQTNSEGSHNVASQEVHFWMIEFNQVTGIMMDNAGLEKAVSAFVDNDPYYPRPSQSPSSWWDEFKSIYIMQSQQILEKEQWNLATQFLEMVESRIGNRNSGRSHAD